MTKVKVEGFGAESSIDELDRMKPSVKRMQRPHKADAQFAGRAKIAMLFAKVGVYLHI